MIGGLFSWLLGGGIAAIGGQLNEAYKAKLQAANSEQRIEADKLIARLEAQKAILLAEQRDWRTSWIRPAFALPFVIYNFKLVVWDKVLGIGVTDALSPELYQLQMVVVGAYFIMRPIEKAGRR